MSTKVIFDTETTGLKKEDRIIQVGSIIYDEQNEKLYDELCYTDIVIETDVTKIHGITNKDLENEKSFIESCFYQDLSKLNIDTNYLIAHNINFDLGMLEKEGFKSNYKLIDTLRVARFLLDEDSYRLQDLRYSLGLDLEEKKIESTYNINIKAHNAMGDVLVTKLLLNKLLILIKEKYPNIDAYAKMSDITSTPRLLELMPFGKYKGRKISDIFDMEAGYIDWLLSLNDLDIDIEYSLKEIKKFDKKENMEIDLPSKLKYGPYSYSRVGCYQNCPKAFKYRYIDKVIVEQEDQVLSKALEKDSYLHSLLECTFLNLNIQGDIPSFKDMNELESFKVKYKDKIEYPINFMESLLEFDEIFLTFVNSEHLKKIVTDYDEYEPEAYSEISCLDEGLLFRGYIDLKTKKDNHIGIIDWKSGRSNQYDGIQLGNYALSEMLKDPSISKITVFYALIEQNNNEMFTYLKESVETVEKLNNPNIKSIYEIINWMERNVSRIENESKWERNSEANCYWCDFKNHCEKDVL